MQMKVRVKSLAIMQLFGTMLLIGAAWFMAEFDQGKATLQHWMTKEIEVNQWLADSPVQAWMLANTTEATRVQAYPSGWFAPVVAGKVSETFQQTGKGIVLQTDIPSEVRAIGDGEVVLCVKPASVDSGWTVVVAHADHAKSIYGMLSQSSVRVGDTVKGGQTIGWIQEKQLYFAFKQDAIFLDPEAVIGFD
jgi:stage IV sporulation protein FA